MNKISAAIFDMDGTLVDSMGAWHDDAVRYLKKLGIEAEPGLGDRMFTLNSRTGAQYILDHYPVGKTLEEVMAGLAGEMADFYANEAELKPGAREILERFRARGIPMAVVTSTDGANTRMALRRTRILSYFDGVYNAGDLGMPKTEPDIFLLAASDLGAEPEKTWVFEDGLYAVRTAGRAGFPTVGVYDRISEDDQEDLEKESDLYVREMTELSRYF